MASGEQERAGCGRGATENGPEPSGHCAVIGLGSMGGGMARALLRAGFAVRGYDRTEATCRAFADAGGTVAADPAAAARDAHCVVAVVVNAAQTADVLFGVQGCAETMPAGGVFVSCATMAPDQARALGGRLEATGRYFLDAPMSGGAARAADGALTMLASGRAEAFARARPALSAMTATLYELGDAPGTGSAFKMVNQLLAGAHIAAACEAMAFAARQGLDLARVYEVITRSAGNSWMFENRVPHILAGDYTPLSAVNIFTKDLGIVLDMARADSFPVPVAGAALQMFLMTASAGMGGDDDSSVARLYAQVSGIALP